MGEGWGGVPQRQVHTHTCGAAQQRQRQGCMCAGHCRGMHGRCILSAHLLPSVAEQLPIYHCGMLLLLLLMPLLLLLLCLLLLAPRKRRRRLLHACNQHGLVKQQLPLQGQDWEVVQSRGRA